MVDDAEDGDEDDFNMMSVFVTQPTHKICEYGDKGQRAFNFPTNKRRGMLLFVPPAGAVVDSK